MARKPVSTRHYTQLADPYTAVYAHDEWLLTSGTGISAQAMRCRVVLRLCGHSVLPRDHRALQSSTNEQHEQPAMQAKNAQQQVQHTERDTSMSFDRMQQTAPQHALGNRTKTEDT